MNMEVSRKQNASSPCAACKLLRRRCSHNCIFAPYFPAEEPHKFASVHKVFGASNVSKMLQELPEEHRRDAVSSMVYEANARMRDPVYGCVGAISYMQQQIDGLRQQLALTQAEMVQLRAWQTVSPSSSTSQLSSYTLLSHSKPSNFDMDMIVEQATFRQSMWSST